jgi:polyhydroxyalkanoate synthase subunit PhaC
LDLDPALFGRALGAAAVSVARHPEAAARAGVRCALDLVRTSHAAASRATGHNVARPVSPDAGDRRFSDPAWEDNAAFFALRQSFLVLRRLAEDLLDAAELDTATGAKAVFAAALLADALAPTNLLLTNPAALKRAFETGGQSVVAGSRNCIDDILHNGGRPRQVDASSFRLGENMAATPSKVVYRNDVMELLQRDHIVPWTSSYQRRSSSAPMCASCSAAAGTSPGS